MKKLLIIALALIGSMGASWAQNSMAPAKGKRTSEQRAEAFTKRMTKNLELDAAQQERIKAINLERFKQLDEARAGQAESRKEVASKVKSINEIYVTNLKGVLNEDQFKKFEEMKQELMEKTMQKRKGQ